MTSASKSPGNPGWIARLIATSASNPFVVILFVVAATAWGVVSLRHAPLDAIPDLSDVQVIVFTEWMGQSPDLVEDQVTYPISSALISAPKVQAVRGQSMFGMSFVNVIFDEGTDIYWARSRVLEYLSSVRARLPQGVNPTLGPDATGVGWVFEYALVDRTGKHDLQELRSLQDWNLRYALGSVPGVAEVASVGGFVKQYQVNVDPTKLLAYGIGMDDVVRAVRASNQEVGGRVLEMGGHEQIIRGRGYVKDPDDIGRSPIKANDGTPVRVRDVAQVSIGPDIRRGLSELNGDGEAPGGIVIMRYGENALTVIEAVKERLRAIQPSLPPGVEVISTYDRSQLIEESVATLRHTLVEEMIVVSVVIFLFLLHARSALIPIVTLPVGVLLAFVPMFYQHLTANIMSLGGIAVAIGAMVDASIILIENIHKKLGEWDNSGQREPRTEVIVQAMQEVGPSIFLSLLVITVSFLPVFTLEATEGRLFKPLAFTKTYSIGFASILAVTLTPALAVLFIRGKVSDESRNPVNRWLTAAYTPVVRFVFEHRWKVVALAVLVMVLTAPAALRLGSEFMPPLNEGVILYMPTAPPGMSENEASVILQSMDRELKKFPEVASVFGKMGRAETATDPAPLGMAEVTVVLRPRSEWRPGLTWEGLLEEMDEKLHYPGMPNVWWMPIQTRTEMLATGVKSPLGIEVYGDDLETIEKAAIAVEHAVSKVPGTRSAFAERSTGGFYVDVEVDREAAARHGLSVQDVNMVVAQSIGGENVSETVEGRERYPINVRYAREYRDEPELLGRTLVSTPAGAQVPLSQVATVRGVLGPPMIRSEGGKLVGFVFVDTDRPIADYVAEARYAVARDVQLPVGHAPRMGGAVQVLRARPRAPEVGRPADARSGLRPALLQHEVHRRDGDRHARGPLLARRRDLASLPPELQPQRGRLGRPHRARRSRRRDRRRDASLPQAGVRSVCARRAAPVARRPSREHRGGGREAPPTEAHDGGHDDHRAGAHPLEHRHGSRRHEADRGADDRRPRHVVPPRADRVSGPLRNLERTWSSARGAGRAHAVTTRSFRGSALLMPTGRAGGGGGGCQIA